MNKAQVNQDILSKPLAILFADTCMQNNTTINKLFSLFYNTSNGKNS